MNPGFPKVAPTPKGGVANQLLPPATKLREGNVFTPVCDSVHGRGVCPGGLCQGDPPPYGNVRAVRILRYMVSCGGKQKYPPLQGACYYKCSKT